MPLPGSQLVHPAWAANTHLFDRTATITRQVTGQDEWGDPIDDEDVIYTDVPCAVAIAGPDAGAGGGGDAGERRTASGELVWTSRTLVTDQHLPLAREQDLVELDGDGQVLRVIKVEHARGRWTRLALQDVT